MKKIKKSHIFMPLFLLVLMFSLTGCFGESFDASRYVKGCLDASTKGVFEDYIATTNQTEEQAKKEYEDRIDSDLKSIAGAVNLDEKQQEEWKNLFKGIYGKYKYEVGEATKGENMSFTVPVKVSRLQIFNAALEEAQKKSEDDMKKMLKKNKNKTPSNDEIMQIYFDNMKTVLQEKLENPEYGAEETVNVTVKLNQSTNEYEVDDTSVNNLFAALDDSDSMQ